MPDTLAPPAPPLLEATDEDVPEAEFRTSPAWPLLRLVGVAAAVWPVWAYLARFASGPGGDPSGVLLLALAVEWAVFLHARAARAEEARSPAGANVWILLALGAYAWGYGRIPALAGVLLGLAAFAAALFGLRGVRWREHSGLAMLCLLSAPSPITLSMYLGGPMRAASAAVAGGWLRLLGAPVRVEGATLWIGERLVSVDAPCSGVNGLWSAVAATGVLAVYRRLSPLRTAILLALAAALCIPANGWRAVALVSGERLLSAGGKISPDTGHVMVGLVVFAVHLLLLAWASRLLARRPSLPAPASRLSPSRSAAFPRRFLSSLAWAWMLPFALLGAAYVPQLPRSRPPAAHRAFPGWPSEWWGQPIRRKPQTDLDRQWAALSGGPVARFALPDGGELLLRWVEHPFRDLHSPEICYKGFGYAITPMSPLRAPLNPGGKPALWQRFRAERGGHSWEVRGIIVSAATGETYPDASWWRWRVAGPGATDGGPWWNAAVQTRR